MKILNKSEIIVARKVLTTIRDNCVEELEKSHTREIKGDCGRVRLYQLTDELLKDKIWEN